MLQSPQAPQAPNAPQPIVVTPQQITGGAAAEYNALRQQREVLRDWQSRAENRRAQIQRSLERATSEADRAGLQSRLAETDQRIIELEKQMRDVENRAAQVAAVPGAIQPVFPGAKVNGNDVRQVLPIVFTIFVLGPISIAFALRMVRRKARSAVAAVPDAIYERFSRMEQAIDTIAIEVERVSEGQRFLTKVMAERSIGPGAAQPVELQEREKMGAVGQA